MNWSSSGETLGILIAVMLCLLDKKREHIPTVVINVGGAGMWISNMGLRPLILYRA